MRLRQDLEASTWSNSGKVAGHRSRGRSDAGILWKGRPDLLFVIRHIWPVCWAMQKSDLSCSRVWRWDRRRL